MLSEILHKCFLLFIQTHFSLFHLSHSPLHSRRKLKIIFLQFSEIVSICKFYSSKNSFTNSHLTTYLLLYDNHSHNFFIKLKLNHWFFSVFSSWITHKIFPDSALIRIQNQSESHYLYESVWAPNQYYISLLGRYIAKHLFFSILFYWILSIFFNIYIVHSYW